MSIAIIGALVGLIFGYIAFEVVNRVAKSQDNPDIAKVLRIVAALDVIIFPVVGYFVAPMVFGGN